VRRGYITEPIARQVEVSVANQLSRSLASNLSGFLDEYKVVAGQRDNQSTTLASGTLRRSSDKTLVSSR